MICRGLLIILQFLRVVLQELQKMEMNASVIVVIEFGVLNSK